MKKVFLKVIALAMAMVLALGSMLIALSEDGTEVTTEPQQETPAPVVVVTPVPEPTVNEETPPVENTQAPAESIDMAAETETPEPSDQPEGDLEAPAPTEMPTETPTDTAAHPYLRFQESNGELIVVGCDPTCKAAQIPAFDNGLPVVHIGERAFENCLLLETVEVSEGVKTIGKMAFAGCESLRAVILPKSVEGIAKDAFEGCDALQTIEAPKDSVAEAFAQSFFATPATEDADEEIETPAETEANVEDQSEGEQAAARELEALPDPEASIELNGQLQLGAGKSTTLKATVSSEQTINKTLKWTTSDASVATVSAKGVVTAKKVIGETTVEITATLVANPKVSATLEMTIAPLVTKVTVTGPRTYLDINLPGDRIDLSAACAPANANQTVAWKSNNAAIASVDAVGKVTVGTKTGTATITATAQDGSGKAGTYKVTVVRAVETVSLSGPTEVAKGKSIKLTTAFTPTNATNKNLIWKSSDTKIATVANGTVKGVSVGTVSITATSKENANIKKEVQVTVKPTALAVMMAQAGSEIDLSSSVTTLSLSATISPSDASQNVIWKSSNVKVATVEQDGVVTGKAPGKVTITATAQDGSGKKATKVITVLRHVTSVSVEGYDKVAMGKSLTLTAKITPADATNKAVTWKSDNPYVTISAAGVVKPGTAAQVGVTTANITATSKDGNKESAPFPVTVTEPVKTVTISATPDVTTLDLSDVLTSTVQLSANTDVTWKSSNNKIATVSADGGLVTAVKTGTVTITATAKDGSGAKATLKITVTSSVTDVETTSPDVQSVAVGKTVTLTARVLPLTALDKKLTWTSSDDTVAKVSATGVVTGVKVSDTPVTITVSKDGAFPKTFTVTVKAVPTSLKVAPVTPGRNYINLNVPTQSPLPLTATVLPAEASQEVTWKSSNKKVADVDPSGVVIAGKAGSATITATTCDGSKKSATFKVTVFSGASGITLRGDSALRAGSKTTLSAVVAPSNANKTLTWTSSDKTVATVDVKGVVTAKATVMAETDVTITATSKQDPTIQATRTITVWPKESGVMITMPDSYIIFNSSLQTMQLSAGAPDNAPGGVVWRSSNTKIASVDEDGLVTAQNVGTVIITATASDGSGRMGRKFLEVIRGVNGLTIQGATDLGAGVTTQLTVVPNPVDATYAGVKKWTSSDESIATVDADGNVTAKQGVTGVQMVTIKAQSTQNEAVFSDPHIIAVRPKVESITLSPTSKSFDLNEEARTVQVNATVAPSTAKPGVLWSTSNATVATVDQNGLVTVLNAGTATITATALDCSGVTGTFIVEVIGADYIFEDVTGGVKLLQYVGDKNVTALVIPERIAGKKVVELGDGLFKGYTKLKGARIPSGVTVIPAEAFSGCTALESVTICNNVTAIKKWAFKGCSKLKAMTAYDAQ